MKGFVTYRLPKSDSVITIQGKWKDYTEIVQQEGFCFQPFNDSNIYFLHPSDEESNKINLKSMAPEEDISNNMYLQMIQEAIESLQAGEIDKIVMARGISVSKPIDIEATFSELLANYPDAFCYQLYHPKFGLWMGASPETLLQGKDDDYKTMALAGTQPIDNIRWTTKEEEEQAFVKNEILSLLRQYDVKDLHVSPRQNKSAGAVVHLLNTITFSTSKEVFNIILNKLHPTSAVCGLPKEKALPYILEHEQLQRKLYSGFLGIVNKKTIDLFVNLRCMEVFQNGVRIFVGGGITKDSLPENEWEETLHKSKTVKNILIHE